MELGGPAGAEPLELEPAFRQLRADDRQVVHPDRRTRRSLSEQHRHHAADLRDAVREAGAGGGKRQDEHPGHEQGHEQGGQAAPALEPLEQPFVERPTRERQDQRPQQGGEEWPQHGEAAQRQDHEQRDHHDLLDALLRFHRRGRSLDAALPLGVQLFGLRPRVGDPAPPLARIAHRAQAQRAQNGDASWASRNPAGPAAPPHAAQSSRARPDDKVDVGRARVAAITPRMPAGLWLGGRTRAPSGGAVRRRLGRGFRLGCRRGRGSGDRAHDPSGRGDAGTEWLRRWGFRLGGMPAGRGSARPNWRFVWWGGAATAWPRVSPRLPAGLWLGVTERTIHQVGPCADALAEDFASAAGGGGGLGVTELALRLVGRCGDDLAEGLPPAAAATVLI